MTVADLIMELNRCPAEMPVMFMGDEMNTIVPIICICSIVTEDNTKVVVLS